MMRWKGYKDQDEVERVKQEQDPVWEVKEE